ncbi:MAG: glycosyltransferase family 2 protein [Thalassovita sp.]
MSTSNAGIKWGLVSTIKAPTDEILKFCAHHLDLGAHRLFIYLDDDNQEAYRILSDHPKIRPVLTDDRYWKKLGMKRRVKHQSRQFQNARHAYGRAVDVDWLTHIDVDEFLWPETALGPSLAALAPECLCARVRPVEALSGAIDAPTQFKGFSLNPGVRRRQTEKIYPTFGAHLNGGFLSHVAGKMFYRTGVADLKVQIHNVFVGEEMNPGQIELESCKLLHMHAQSWPAFWRAFQFRMEKGSYRSELKPNRPRANGGLSLHELFTTIYEAEGETGMHAFYDEVCAGSEDLQRRLSEFGLLHSCDLELEDKRDRYFPEIL